MKLTVNGHSSDNDTSWGIRNDDEMPVYQRRWVSTERRVIRLLGVELRPRLIDRAGVRYFSNLRNCVLPGDLRS